MVYKYPPEIEALMEKRGIGCLGLITKKQVSEAWKAFDWALDQWEATGSNNAKVLTEKNLERAREIQTFYDEQEDAWFAARKRWNAEHYGQSA